MIKMKLREDLILREMGKEYVIVDPSQDVVDMSKVFTLNETAATIWKEMQGLEFSTEDVANFLTKEYEVSHDQALNDATALLTQFKKEGLLES